MTTPDPTASTHEGSARKERRANLSAAQRALLEKRLRGKSGGTSQPPPPHSAIPPRDPDAPNFAAYAQQRLYFLHEMAPRAAAYNMFDALRLRGALDVLALEQALQGVVERHQSLRTTFTTQNDETVAVIAPELALAVPVVDLAQSVGEAATWETAQRRAEAEIRRPFDLRTGPLLRMTLIRVAPDEHLLVLVVHHIIADEWSLGLFWRELAAGYAALRSGASPALPELPLQYADFAAWQRGRWQAGELEPQLAYWREQLAGELPVLHLPCDRPRPDAQTFRGALISAPLPAGVVTALKEIGQAQGATLFMTVLAAFNVLLHRYTGGTDIPVGTPAATRDDPGVQGLIGLFLNTLVLRTDLSGNPRFDRLLARVRDVALDAYAHRELPVEKLVETLHPSRDGGRNPLFQVMFVHQTEQSSAVDFPGLTATPVTLDYGAAKFDLTLFLGETEGETRLSIEYNTDLFDAATVQRMMGHMGTLLVGIAAQSATRIGELPLLTPVERGQVLAEWNDTALDYGPARTVHELIAEHAAATPDAVAVVCDDVQLSYRELNMRAAALARRLRARGVGPNTCVGICLERSPEQIVAILGVLRAGGAYVPLDPGYPAERLAFMLRDSGAPVLVTHSARVERLPDHAAQVLCVDGDAAPAGANGGDNRGEHRVFPEGVRPLSDVSQGEDPFREDEPDIEPEDLAYVIYTSGSTGQPKGVAITHGNLLHSTLARFHVYPEPLSSFLLLSSFAFDSSIVGIFWTLCRGGALVLPPPGSETDVPGLAALINRHRISHLLCLPSLYDLLLTYAPAAQLDSLRVAIVAGEACPSLLPQRHYAALPDAALYNEYGPTEGSVWCTAHKIPPEHPAGAPVPIGRPIPNMAAHVLDPYRQPVPVGVAGELYIGGAGLARGYVNRPDLTEERFVSHPFAEEMLALGDGPHGARLYRTGDRVRWCADGTLEFLGRIDQQVKIRGFRVELGEIETVLVAHPAVEAAVVAVHGDGADQRLVAYVVWRNPAETPGLQALRQHVGARLPAYMVPAQWVPLDALPRTPNGKVDRNQLPAPGAAGDAVPDPSNGDVAPGAPRDALEIQLVRIWESVLKVRPLGIHDDYFALGGHSLGAVALFGRMREMLGRDLPLSTLLSAPTIAQQAELLRQEGWSPDWSSLVPLQPGGSNPPFFCMHAVGGNVLSLRHLARHLGPDQPFYALQSQGLDGKETVPTTVEEMAAYYIDEMRTVQPHGPYLLGGQSSGGLVAFEVARQLRAAGEAVALLALIDSYAPLPQSGSAAGRTRSAPLSPSERLRFHLRRVARQGVRYLWQAGHRRLIKTGLSLRRGLENGLVRVARRVYNRLDQPLPPRLRPIYVRIAVENALYAYAPSVYHGPITLLRATESVGAHLESIYGSQMGWTGLTTERVDVHDVEGGHNLEEEPQVVVVAEILQRCIVEVL